MNNIMEKVHYSDFPAKKWYDFSKCYSVTAVFLIKACELLNDNIISLIQVNDSVLTDMPAETVASNILAPFPSQRSISLSAGRDRGEE